MTISTIKNGSRSVLITQNDAQSGFYSFLVLNNGETATTTNASHKTAAGAKKWANKVLAI